MRLTVVLLFLLFLLPGAHAQQDDLSGYLITLQGDTDRVVIKNDVEGKYKARVMVRRNGSYQELDPDAITGFGVPDKFHYRRVSYTNPLRDMQTSRHFAKVLFDGTQKLYSFLENDNLYFVYQNRDTTCLIYNDQKQNAGELVASGNYRNQLYFFGRNCAADANDAERLGYGERVLTAYAAALEQCLGSYHSRQVLYRKEKASSQWNIYAAGMAWSGRSDLLFQLTQRKTFPGKSRNTSLNFGLLVSQSSSQEAYKTLLAGTVGYQQNSLIALVPVYIQYNLTDGRVQPFVYGGLGVAYLRQTEVEDQYYGETREKGNFGVGLMLGAGLECRLNPHWWIKADCRYDLLFHLPVVGVMYKF